MDRKALDHLADLASVTLTSDEAESLVRDLEKIVAYVSELQALDVEGVAPTTGMGSTAAPREDEPKEGLTHDEALAGAPQVESEGFAVPTFVADR